PEGEIDELNTISCDESHDLEVFHVLTYRRAISRAKNPWKKLLKTNACQLLKTTWALITTIRKFGSPLSHRLRKPGMPWMIVKFFASLKATTKPNLSRTLKSSASS